MCEMGDTFSKRETTSGYSDSTDGIFYHYTSTALAKKIKSKGVIPKGKYGTILNKMQPDRYYREEILMNNYGEMARNHENKADYVILVTELDYKHLEQFKESGRHYFLYHDDIHISESQVFNKPKCERPSNSIATDTMGDSQAAQNLNQIIINLRKDQSLDDAANQRYQSDNVTIFAPKWVENGLEILRNFIEFPRTCKQIDKNGDEKTFKIHDLSLKTLQQLSRNEKWNTNGKINFEQFGDLEQSVVLSLKDLVRQTVIVGTDQTTHYGGLRNSQRIDQNTEVYICDLIALQFQQNYNTGRLVVIGENLPKGKLDDIIYESITGESKPSYETARQDNTNRFIDIHGCFFDSKTYIKFVSRDVLLSFLAVDRVAKEKITFKFVKYGCGFYAGQFSGITNSLISHGVADGLKEVLPKVKNISSIELIYFERDEEIVKICEDNGIEVVFSNDDPLKKTHEDRGMATTNCADNHACIGNPMGFNSVDGAIAENLMLKGFNFCPNINQSMKEEFLNT